MSSWSKPDGRFGQLSARLRLSACAAVLVAPVVAVPLSAQEPLSAVDYGQWERLGAFELDPTGRWLVAAVTRVDETRELRLHRADGSGDVLVLEQARNPEFSRDGRWMVFRRSPTPEEAEESEEPIADRLGVVDLSAGRDTVLFDVQSFAFREDGSWIAAHGPSPSDSVGGDLVIMNPATGARTVVSNVAAFAWQDEGELLAASLRTTWGEGNGVVLFDSEAGTLRTIESGDADYVGLTWREESSQLAVMRSVAVDGYDEPTHDVLVWDDVRAGQVRLLDAVGRDDMPSETRVTEYAGIRFADGGRTVFVGLRPWEPAPGDEADADASAEALAEGGRDSGDGGDTTTDEVPPADVQVWHWNDDQILRAQEYRSSQIARQTFVAAWHLDQDRLVVLGDQLEEPVAIVDDGRWGIVPDYDPYLFERRFGAGTADWYRVDVASGERVRLASSVEFALASRDDGGTVLLYDDAWVAIDLASGDRTPIGGSRSFTRSIEDFDYPGPRPSWGIGAWLDDGSGVLVYDKHDVWLADLSSGSLERLTSGAEEGHQYRVVNLDPDGSPFGPPTLDGTEPVWLTVRDLRTKESGYASLELGGEVDVQVFEQARVAGLTRARSADRLALRMERWDDSPDVFVGDEGLEDLVQITRTNPFQREHAWGHAELLDYTTDAGHDLQAILVYPAGFEEGQRYPLILYQYERLSDGLHSYDVPSERDYYNYQVWSQQGYFVLMPDIVYEPGRPGPSALDAVEHALDAAVATGHVDPGAMGLIGHSWGGYQASYLPTRTDRFAASVAGAAITNFMSFMGAVHWNGGLPETGHWETGQARMAAPYWEDLEGHLESSPANFITDLTTPMLLMHGDQDGVVDFYQGLEFYNYARRAGKEVVLLVYPGADHGLSDESQQVDYHRRILEWFGHYLKGEPAPSWITDGESWVERAKRLGGWPDVDPEDPRVGE